MPQSARTKTWQRVIDCLAGSIITALGILELQRFWFGPWPAIIWSLLMIGTGAAVIVGAILRTVKPGRRQSVGFQFELGGWGGSAALVFWYAVINFQHDHDRALLGALLLIVVMLLGSWLRLVSAMHDVSRRRRA